jgi:hypothetical protein
MFHANTAGVNVLSTRVNSAMVAISQDPMHQTIGMQAHWLAALA